MVSEVRVCLCAYACVRVRVHVCVTHRSDGTPSEEGDAVPGGDQHPGGREARELRVVGPDVGGGPLQGAGVQALPVEHLPRPPVVHVGPEGRHHAAVPGDGERHGGELGHLPQEGHQPVVVDLETHGAGTLCLHYLEVMFTPG